MEKQASRIERDIPAAHQEIRCAARSHIGASPLRALLEDRSRAERVRTGAGMVMYLGVVADGIGGENAGERAAEVTVNTVFEHCSKSIEHDIPSMLKNALEEANELVYAESRRSRRKMNMGSTASVAAIVEGRLYLANVGDSRIYLIRGDNVSQLTIDHTWENEVVRVGRLSREEAKLHPRKDEIVRSIGYERSLEVDLGVWLHGGEESQEEAEAAQGTHLQPTDRVFICSDGVTKNRHDKPMEHYVEEREFPELVQGRSPEQAADAILKCARSRKVDDNVSAVFLEVVGEERIQRRLPSIRVLGIAALILTMIVGGLILIRRIRQATPSVGTAPSIPDLPVGVAYVSEMRGLTELQISGDNFQELQLEQIISSGQGMRIRTLGTDAYIRFDLADQSILYLGPDTQIELRAIADGLEVDETFIKLEHGMVLVLKEESGGLDFVVASPIGIQARAVGSLMGVSFDPNTSRLHVDCFHEKCSIEGLSHHELKTGEHLWMAADGSVGEIDPARADTYVFGGDLISQPTAMVMVSTEAKTAPPTNTLAPLFVPPTLTFTPVPTRTPKPPPTPTPTNTPTKTPIPTDTPEPTNTPRPTRTPRRSPTPTDTEAPSS